MFNKLKKIFTKKNSIWAVIVIVVLAAGYFIFFNKKTTQQTLTVHPAGFLQQVSASGTVVPKKDIDLSFQQAGQVTGVYVNVGDSVIVDQLLANQDTSELDAEVLQMQAGINLQQAKLDQLLAGASTQDIQSAQDAINAAQQNLVSAYASSLNTLANANTAIYNAFSTVSTIQNNYFTASDQESITVQDSKNAISNAMADANQYLTTAQTSSNTADTDAAISHTIDDVNTAYNNVAIIRNQCDQGQYYLKVSAADKTTLDTQKATLNTTVTSVTASQSSIASYKIALSQAQNQLNSLQAPARPSDIAVYQAQIEQAKASLQATQAQLNDEKIYSPINGVVAAVNAKVGNIMSPSDVALSVISANNFEVDSYVPEINIALIKVGNPAVITLDAYGSNTLFDASVVSVDPAQTIENGVSTYKVTLDFANTNDTRIKSGMTGNIIMTTLQKSNVISVPQGIVTMINSQSFVKVKKGNSIINTPIQTGDVASNGNIEVTSGLKDGDVVVEN